MPVCPRCNRLLHAAGREGRRLKATGEWWHAGHTVGRNFDSPAANAVHERAESEAEKQKQARPPR